MLNSRNIDDLRPDVAAACRYGLDLCKKKGLSVLVTATVRDEEYQMWCVNNGYASKNATKPTFHSVKAGLAFDFCKNVKGQEYSDIPFFKSVADVFKGLGFFWGGDWKSFPDKPHLQWDGYKHEYTGNDILAGRYPPTLIIKEDDEVTQEQFNKMMEVYLTERSKRSVADWAKSAWTKITKPGGLYADTTNPQGFVTREQLAQTLDKAGMLK